MGKVHSKVIRVLRHEFADVRDLLDELPGGRVSGIIVSSSFEKLDHAKRQKRFWAILRDNLDQEELDAVGAVALLTPAEASVKAA